MRITRLEAENFKRLKAVDITPGSGNAVVIGGRNAQGKSSVLDAIMATLAGKKGAKDLTRPIRDGESHAEVTVELDDLVVVRRWTASGSTVTVSPKGGASKLSSPQAVLDRLIGTLTFDPLAFAESAPKDQVATVIDIIGREDFDRIAEERKAAYDERTDVNREVKRLSAQVDGLPPGDGQDVGERVDYKAVIEERKVAERRRDLLAEHARVAGEIERLQGRLNEIATEGAALPQTRTVEALDLLLDSAVAQNKRVDDYERLMGLLRDLASAQGSAQGLTDRIAGLDAQRADLISRAALPVPGLSFDDEGLTYNGVPFHQASAAERLKVSVGMAMALNPDLRVICVRDASLLDDDSKRALVAMATEHDFQVWIEVVGTPAGGVGVVIEDGQVQA